MFDLKQLNFAINQICEEKNIPKEKIIEALELALAAAYKKDYSTKSSHIKVVFNEESGLMNVVQIKKVVRVDDEENVILTEEEKEVTEEGEEKNIKFNPDKHITLDEAKKIQKNIKEGEEISINLEAKADFGRIAAQTAKQVILQRIREVERDTIFDSFKDKQGEVLTGTIQRIERGIVFVDIGKATGLLFPSEQVRTEMYRIGDRHKFLITTVEKTDRDPNILLSRKSTEFVKGLFTLEIPEIFAGTVTITSIAREPGIRTKLAVMSTVDTVDAVGACVGQRGTRVQSIIAELGGEKLDIIEYSKDINKFIEAAIAPAKAHNITVDEQVHKAFVKVADNELSLAIGGGGQNVRLASQLTGYDIDLRGETQEQGITEPIIVDEKDIEKAAEEVGAE